MRQTGNLPVPQNQVSFLHKHVLHCSSFTLSFLCTPVYNFCRNSINIGLPIIECPEAAKGIDAGDDVEVDFDSGMIYNKTKGTEFKGQAFPEFMQKIIKAEGLVNYINANTTK